jgi:endoglucanase
MDWPNGTREAEKEMWGHITSPVDEQWQNAFVDYMKDKGIEACYWSINPESGDTGGIYTHEYDPVSAKDMWGRWGPMDTRKTNLLKRLWGN